MLRCRLLFTNLFLCSFVIFVAAILGFGATIYYNATLSLKDQLGSKCAGSAYFAALLASRSGGNSDLAALTDQNSEHYKKVESELDAIRLSSGGMISFLRMQPELPPGVAEKRLPSADSAEDFTPDLAGRFITPEMGVYQGAAPFYTSDFVFTPQGEFILGYAPIFGASGEMSGWAEAGVSVEQYDRTVRNLRFALFGGAILLTLLVLLVMLLSSGRVGRLIITDHLTGTFNKSHFLKSFFQHAVQAKKRNVPLSLLMCDLDYFKRINDTYGHPFGDIMLKKIADTITCALRKTDYLARYGGEEFACFLPGMTQEDAVKVAQRIREAVSHTRVYSDDRDEEVGITISIGVAQLLPDEKPEATIERADKALYKAKHLRDAVIVCARSAGASASYE